MAFSRRVSRRRFLRDATAMAAGAASVPTIVPSGVLGAPGRPGANDRIGVGYIGAGRRANQLMNLPPEGRIVAADGGEFIGDQGKIRIGNNVVTSNPENLAQTDPGALTFRLPPIDNYIQNWFDCIKSRQRPIADVEIGHRSAILCHLGNIARWVGRRLQWDPVQEIFPGDDEANGYLDRPRRPPYELPHPV